MTNLTEITEPLVGCGIYSNANPLGWYDEDFTSWYPACTRDYPYYVGVVAGVVETIPAKSNWEAGYEYGWLTDQPSPTCVKVWVG
jgi:hypothetical protein